jgi:hypothetical protein
MSAAADPETCRHSSILSVFEFAKWPLGKGHVLGPELSSCELWLGSSCDCAPPRPEGRRDARCAVFWHTV